MAFRRVVSARPRTKAKGKGKKEEKARKELTLNPDFQLLKHPMKKEMPCLGIGRLVCQPLV